MSAADSRSAPPVDLKDMMSGILKKVSGYNPNADKDKLWRTFRFADEAHRGQVRKSGEPFFAHALTVVDILADLRLDVDTLVAGLVHDVVEDTKHTLEHIAAEFGKDVASMVDGVTKIGELPTTAVETRQAENYRKLILSIAQDPRTVLIKLADRLHNMRTIEFLAPDRQRDIALETLDVYAPLAHRFGIAKIKWELEDRAFKVLQPDRYFEIERGISQSRAQRERLIEEVRGPLEAAIAKAGFKATITGRPKHFFSIYRKMRAQDLSLDRIYDLLAVRVIVQSKADCYHALGIIHSLFPPLSDRIKDYIAIPKPNMYQSLHTTVRVPGGKFVEVQIRTEEMHERSELGIAAHWRYKEGSTEATDFSGMVKWLRQIMAWQEDVTDPREFMESLRIDFFQDEVFVFSPNGDLFQLPRGSTPLDFAFRIHSQVGLRCVGAKVNGRLVSLRTALENRDNVEILTANNARPSSSWLEIVKTSRAKHHIRRWAKSTQYQQSVRLGRDIIERELARQKLRIDLENELVGVAQILGYNEADKLLAAVGRGEMAWQRVINRLQPPPPPSRTSRLLSAGKDLAGTLLRRPTGGVRIAGMDNLMISLARCCQPIPGDHILGVITRGRGVSVHRIGCPNLNDPQIEVERKIEVQWDAEPDQSYLVKLVVIAMDRRNLLADIGHVISATGSNIRSGEFTSENELARATLQVEVATLNNLQKVLKAVAEVKGVQKVERFQAG